MTDWSKLPSVVVVEILTYLSPADRLSSSSVCTSWRNCLFCACHWRDFVLKINIDDAVSKLRTKCLVERIGRFVRQVVIYFESSVPSNVTLTAQVLESIATNPNLQYVKICPTSGRLEHTERSAVIRYVEALKSLIKRSRRLEGIAFGCVEEIVDNADQFLQQLSQFQSESLRHLYMASVKENPDCYKSLSLSPAVFAEFRHLQSLSIDYDYLSEDLLENLARSDHTQMLRLDIHVHGSSMSSQGRRSISDAVWKKLGDHSPNLEISLTLLHSTQATHQLMDILQPSMRLARFSQYFCATINAAAIYFIAYTFVKSFRSICIVDAMEHFDADLYEAPEEDPFVMLAWRCENLLEFTLIGYNIAMHDLIAIVRLRSAKLKIFKIPECCIEYPYDPVTDYNVLCHEVSGQLDQSWSPIANDDLHPALLDWHTDAVGMYITQIFSQQIW